MGSRRINKKKYMNKTKHAKQRGSKLNENIGKLMKISQLPILKGALIMKGHIVAKGGSVGIMSKTLKKAVRFADNVLDSVNGKKITGGEPTTPSLAPFVTEPVTTVTEVSPEVIDAASNIEEKAPVESTQTEEETPDSISGQAEEQHKFVPTSCGIKDLYEKRDLYEDTTSTVVSVTPEKGGSKKKRRTRNRRKP